MSLYEEDVTPNDILNLEKKYSEKGVELHDMHDGHIVDDNSHGVVRRILDLNDVDPLTTYDLFDSHEDEERNVSVRFDVEETATATERNCEEISLDEKDEMQDERRGSYAKIFSKYEATSKNLAQVKLWRKIFHTYNNSVAKHYKKVFFSHGQPQKQLSLNRFYAKVLSFKTIKVFFSKYIGCRHASTLVSFHEPETLWEGFLSLLSHVSGLTTTWICLFFGISIFINWYQVRHKERLNYSWSATLYVPYSLYLLTVLSESISNDAVGGIMGLSIRNDVMKVTRDAIVLSLLVAIGLSPLYITAAITNIENGSECPGSIHILLSLADYLSLQIPLLLIILVNRSLSKTLCKRVAVNYEYVHGTGGLQEIVSMGEEFCQAVVQQIRFMKLLDDTKFDKEMEVEHVLKLKSETGPCVMSWVDHHEEIRKSFSNISKCNKFGICRYAIGQQLYAVLTVKKFRKVIEDICAADKLAVESPAQYTTAFDKTLERFYRGVDTRMDDIITSDSFDDVGMSTSRDEHDIVLHTNNYIRSTIRAEQCRIQLGKLLDEFFVEYGPKLTYSPAIDSCIDYPISDSAGINAQIILDIRTAINFTSSLFMLVSSYLYTRAGLGNSGFVLILVIFSCAVNVSSANVVNNQKTVAVGDNNSTYYYGIVISSVVSVVTKSLSLESELECVVNFFS